MAWGHLGTRTERRCGPTGVDAVIAGYQPVTKLETTELDRVEQAMAIRPLVLAAWSFATGAQPWPSRRPAGVERKVESGKRRGKPGNPWTPAAGRDRDRVSRLDQVASQREDRLELVQPSDGLDTERPNGPPIG